jgi:hypothetical protein
MLKLMTMVVAAFMMGLFPSSLVSCIAPFLLAFLVP